MRVSPAVLVAVLSFSVPTFAEDDVADIWAAKCKSCHGPDGKAQTKVGKKEKMDDISTPAWQAKHSDEEIRRVISEGSEDNEKMKPFKDKLSAAEIDKLVAYIRQLKK